MTAEPLDQELRLEGIADRAVEYADRGVIDQLRLAAVTHDLRLEDFAGSGAHGGKMTLTTYHKAKGREWDVVLMPGLVDGILPARPWFKEDLTALEFAEERRSFYVGLTRARAAVVLIHGTHWFETNKYGRRFRKSYGSGTSPFMLDVLKHLSTS
ncbi:3'-5' exonuclease [Modestobacter muralis]|uniref:3'-5' exonuclease n=1 Tax=Modestobacter muralis TaxID=1608614 RepID=UPI001B8BDEED|nr:3'-5' exonuclease [Modestobacter muralis]